MFLAIKIIQNKTFNRRFGRQSQVSLQASKQKNTEKIGKEKEIQEKGQYGKFDISL